MENGTDFQAFMTMAKTYFQASDEKAEKAYIFFKGATTQANINLSDTMWAKEQLRVK